MLTAPFCSRGFGVGEMGTLNTEPHRVFGARGVGYFLGHRNHTENSENPAVLWGFLLGICWILNLPMGQNKHISY